MDSRTGQPATPPSDVWPLPINHGTGAASVPERLRELLLAYPRLAVRVIHAQSVRDPLLLSVLLAELHQRIGRREAAAGHARTAVDITGADPAGSPRQILAALMHADLACTLGSITAPPLCRQLQRLTGVADDSSRGLIADALHAVAVYQHTDCQAGHRLLAGLLERHRDRSTAAVVTMLADGLTAMDEHCGPRSRIALVTVRLEPPPGGLLHPDLDKPHPDYLSSRIRAQPARHICPRPHPAPSPAAAGTEQAQP